MIWETLGTDDFSLRKDKDSKKFRRSIYVVKDIKKNQSINKLIITRVDCDIDGDIYYPEIDFTNWALTKTKSYKKDSENDYDFKIEEYLKL